MTFTLSVFTFKVTRVDAARWWKGGLYPRRMTLDQVLLVSVSILTGGFALAGGWIGSRLGRTNEHKQWLRNQRQTAYSEMLGAFDSLYLETGRPSADANVLNEGLFALVSKQGRLSLLGPDEVTAISERLVDETWSMVDAARGIGPDAGDRYVLRDIAKDTVRELLPALRWDLKTAER